MEEREAESDYFVGEACFVEEGELWIAVLKLEQDGVVGEPDQND